MFTRNFGVRLAMKATLLATAVSMIVFSATAVSPTPARAASSNICDFSKIRVLYDVTVSVNKAGEELQFAAMDRISAAGRLCAHPPTILLYIFTDVALGGIPLVNAREQVASLRQQMQPAWTDPARAIAELDRSEHLPTIVVTDGLFEPGPINGPPADSDGYLAKLSSLSSSDEPVLIWALAGPDDPRFPPFSHWWQLLQESGLGWRTVATQASEVESIPWLAAPGPSATPTAETDPPPTTAPTEPSTAHMSAKQPPAAPVSASSRFHSVNTLLFVIGGAATLLFLVTRIALARSRRSLPMVPRYPRDRIIAVIGDSGETAIQRVAVGGPDVRVAGAREPLTIRSDANGLVLKGRRGTLAIPESGSLIYLAGRTIREVPRFSAPFARMPRQTTPPEIPPAADSEFY